MLSSIDKNNYIFNICLIVYTDSLDMHERIDPYRDKHIMDLARKAHIKRYDKALEYDPGANVLDIWCGTGYWSFLLAQWKSYRNRNWAQVPEAIQYAQDHYAHGRVNYFNKA